MKTKLFLIISLLYSLHAYAKDFRTYVSIEGVTEETTLEVTFPNEKKARPVEQGQVFEIPSAAIQQEKFALTVQMLNKKHDLKPCEISVEQIPQFDRAYVCTAQNLPIQVRVRVYTNLHGGHKIRPRQTVARK